MPRGNLAFAASICIHPSFLISDARPLTQVEPSVEGRRQWRPHLNRNVHSKLTAKKQPQLWCDGKLATCKLGAEGERHLRSVLVLGPLRYSSKVVCGQQVHVGEASLAQLFQSRPSCSAFHSEGTVLPLQLLWHAAVRSTDISPRAHTLLQHQRPCGYNKPPTSKNLISPRAHSLPLLHLLQFRQGQKKVQLDKEWPALSCPHGRDELLRCYLRAIQVVEHDLLASR